MKIVFLGNSLTEGAYGGNFVTEIARRIPQHEILNAGIGGDTTLNLLSRVDSDVLAKEPDGVFVMCGGNDAISYLYEDVRKYYRRSKDVPDGIVTPELFARTYRELLTRLQLAHVLVWVGLPPSEYSPELVEMTRQYNSLAEQEARVLNIPVLDFQHHFPAQDVQSRPPLTMETIRLIGQREQSGWSDYDSEQQRLGFGYSFDGLHITPQTAVKFADLIIDFLKL
jgi:lysophospholipase L1-like esterase